MNILINELEGVPVAGDHHALPAVVGADAAHGADDIIGLPSLTFVNGDVHGPEHVLHDGHLHGQLLGHTVAGGLVSIVLEVAEGGAVEVEGDAYCVGLFFLFGLFQNIQEAIDGMGIQTLPGGQRTNAEIRPVNDGVAVQDQQFHTFLHLAPWGVSMISMPRAFSSSRMRSASAQFLAFLASVRAATSASISGSALAASSSACFFARA